MKIISKLVFFLLFFLAVAYVLIDTLSWKDFILFHPQGVIASRELDLFLVTAALMLIVVIPVLIMTFLFPLRYRGDNYKAKYSPNWDYHHLMECIWWGFPCAIVVALSVLTWNSCHELDPFRSIRDEEKPLEIQVVALQWRWLFLYPDQGIATVNYVRFPEKTPLRFLITADAPMNSFWIPQLGGQIYAMPGMQTQLHLESDQAGTYRGSSANFSGRGFAGMRFVAEATSLEDFTSWAEEVKSSSSSLTWADYEQLAKPSEEEGTLFYSLREEGLYHKILQKYEMSMP